MNIGEFKSVKGQLVGYIATQDMDLPKLGLRPVESANERAPKYEVVSLNIARRWIKLGALWEAVTNSTGEIFYQGAIEDPSFPTGLQIALFGNDDDGYRVVWSRPKPQRDTMTGDKPKKRGAPAAFGDGNATDDGQLTSRDDSEMVPF